jgi:hypothetical protein
MDRYCPSQDSPITWHHSNNEMAREARVNTLDAAPTLDRFPPVANSMANRAAMFEYQLCAEVACGSTDPSIRSAMSFWLKAGLAH